MPSYEQFTFKGLRPVISPLEALLDTEHLSESENVVNDPHIFGNDETLTLPTGTPVFINGMLRLRPGTKKWVSATSLTNALTNAQFFRDASSNERMFVTAGVTTVLASPAATGATSVVLLDASMLPSSGAGMIGTDVFTWGGKTSNTLTSVSGVGSDHIAGEACYFDGNLYYAAYNAADWTLLASAVANNGAALSNLGYAGVFKAFSDGGVPVMLYKDGRDNKQLRWLDATPTLNAVASVYGSALGVFDQRSWLSEFSTAGSNGVKDRVFYSDIQDQATYGATSYVTIGTRGYTVNAMVEHNRDFYFLNSAETYRWDTSQLTKLYDMGVAPWDGYHGGNQAVLSIGGKLFFIFKQGLYEYLGEGEPRAILQGYFPNGEIISIAPLKNYLGVGAFRDINHYHSYVMHPNTYEVINVNTSSDIGHSSVGLVPQELSGSTNATYRDKIYAVEGADQTKGDVSFANPLRTKDAVNALNYQSGRAVTQYIYGTTPDELNLAKQWTQVDVYFEPIPVANQSYSGINVDYNLEPMTLRRNSASPFVVATPTGSSMQDVNWKTLNNDWVPGQVGTKWTIQNQNLAKGFIRIKFPSTAVSRQVRLRFTMFHGGAEGSAAEYQPAILGYKLYYNLKPFEHVA